MHSKHNLCGCGVADRKSSCAFVESFFYFINRLLCDMRRFWVILMVSLHCLWQLVAENNHQRRARIFKEHKHLSYKTVVRVTNWLPALYITSLPEIAFAVRTDTRPRSMLFRVNLPFITQPY